ncbi:ribonuclease HII [Thermoplasmatales archaeon ex4572_165]|nr:MAG: ribonuclease HII [Thermoplasmatales archaeon ex4572_165]
MICGVDEAGKGPVMGPLTVAGVCFNDEEFINALGVKDSKKHTPKKREMFEKIIKEKCESFEILIIPASDIDDMRKVMTMNEIEVFAFTKVIKKLKPDLCYVDAADVNESRFGDNIKKQLPKRTEIISKHKADDIYPIVSAASILAKTQRDREISIIAEKLESKINKPMGSGYPADQITKIFLETWVKTYGKLPPHTRKSWNTAKKLMNSIPMKRLDDF